ncbi:MAG: sensor histidine kinase, partial [Ruthenibacterium sp.]
YYTARQTSDASVWESTDYIFYETSIPEAGFSLLSAVDRHALTHDVLRVTGGMVALVLAALGVVMLLMHTILQNMVTPLGTMAEYLALTKSHAPETAVVPLSVDGCAEIRAVSKEFNEMFAEQNRLITELQTATITLYETELGKKQAELDFLRSQINPHFLYNTLEAIKGLALENGDTRIADISTAMGKMFRYSIKGENLVPLFDEIEIAKAYLQIQSTRFPGKINAVFSMADNVQDYYVNKMLLQPVLENSIVHGLTCVENGGILWVGGKCENDNMLLTVQDNGKGMSAETLAQIRAQLNAAVPHDGSGHIGLENVHRRIRLRYGAPYGVEITSEPNQGTRVVLRLPLLQSREELNGDVPCITCR